MKLHLFISFLEKDLDFILNVFKSLHVVTNHVVIFRLRFPFTCGFAYGRKPSESVTSIFFQFNYEGIQIPSDSNVLLPRTTCNASQYIVQHCAFDLAVVSIDLRNLHRTLWTLLRME